MGYIIAFTRWEEVKRAPRSEVCVRTRRPVVHTRICRLVGSEWMC